MNWLQKISQNEDLPLGDPSIWKPGDIAFLSITGISNFVAVKIISWSQITELSDHYIKKPNGVIISPNPFGSMTYSEKEGSTPCLCLKSYGKIHATNDHYSHGKVIIVGPQNIYKTMGDMVKKEVSYIYPHIIMSIFRQDHMIQALKDFPRMKGFDTISDFVDYQIFDIDGYEVEIYKFLHGRESGKFYWNIPLLGKYSLHISKNNYGIFNSLRDALNSAQKYLDYLFPSNPDEVSITTENQ